MASRHSFVRVLEANILETRHSLFQLPELLSRLLQGRRVEADSGRLIAPKWGRNKLARSNLANRSRSRGRSRSRF
jgi:hypothetical protein